MLILKQRGEYEWDVVEERGVRERVLETHPTEAGARERLRQLNARQAQEAMGTLGIFRGAPAGGEGCTCKGVRLDALPCPVHDV